MINLTYKKKKIQNLVIQLKKIGVYAVQEKELTICKALQIHMKIYFEN